MLSCVDDPDVPVAPSRRNGACKVPSEAPLVFAGTPSAAVPSLERLAAGPHEVVAQRACGPAQPQAGAHAVARGRRRGRHGSR